MTFDQWADGICARVSYTIPQVCVKRAEDELYRWIFDGKECQIHALSESAAAFVVLKREGALTNCSFSCRFDIAGASQDEVALRIIGVLVG